MPSARAFRYIFPTPSGYGKDAATIPIAFKSFQHKAKISPIPFFGEPYGKPPLCSGQPIGTSQFLHKLQNFTTVPATASRWSAGDRAPGFHSLSLCSSYVLSTIAR